MAIVVIEAGLSSTIQARPRSGLRHLGVPSSGPADALSMALANRLVGNALLAPAIEATLTGVSLRFDQPLVLAITGATADATLNGETVSFHEAIEAGPGDELVIGATRLGARVYVAIAGGIAVDAVLGSASTYLPAGIGGLNGRALRKGDRLDTGRGETRGRMRRTPDELLPPVGRSWAIRACHGPEIDLLDKEMRFDLFDTRFTVDRRADRMGLKLDGARFRVTSGGRLSSAPVFPGTVQCPESGEPFVLSVDAQTTGGYPRIAQVARCDRHMLGQLRPGDHVRLIWRDANSAARELGAKHEVWREWLPDVETII